jgi:hypothetical protein
MLPEQQAQRRAVLRRVRYSDLLVSHVLLLWADGRHPTEMAVFLFCPRFSVYRIVRAYRTGSLGIRLDSGGQLSVAVQTTVLMPWLMLPLLDSTYPVSWVTCISVVADNSCMHTGVGKRPPFCVALGLSTGFLLSGSSATSRTHAHNHKW